MRLVPALCSVTFRALAPEEIVALAAEADLVAIEWGGDVHVLPGDLDRARAVRALTERHGLRVSSYGSYLQPPRDPPAVVAAALATAAALFWLPSKHSSNRQKTIRRISFRSSTAFGPRWNLCWPQNSGTTPRLWCSTPLGPTSAPP